VILGLFVRCCSTLRLSLFFSFFLSSFVAEPSFCFPPSPTPTPLHSTPLHSTPSLVLLSSLSIHCPLISLVFHSFIHSLSSPFCSFIPHTHTLSPPLSLHTLLLFFTFALFTLTTFALSSFIAIPRPSLPLSLAHSTHSSRTPIDYIIFLPLAHFSPKPSTCARHSFLSQQPLPSFSLRRHKHPSTLIFSPPLFISTH
jgi:hypothetical protein